MSGSLSMKEDMRFGSYVKEASASQAEGAKKEFLMSECKSRMKSHTHRSFGICAKER